MKTYIATSEQQGDNLQEGNRKIHEQVKYLEDIIQSGDIKVDEAAHLQELNMIELKRDICMLETNGNNFSEENKANVYLKTKNKGYYIR